MKNLETLLRRYNESDLNAEELDEKYKVETVEAAKYESVPCMYRIKNERRLRYAKALIAMVCATLGLTKGETQNEDYYLSYETTEALIGKGPDRLANNSIYDTFGPLERRVYDVR